ncbi:hypothetical protein BT96DRAFT_1005523 [Gymnopus androsaceus JB14]|uniref:Uncharacterized protein n=1 Tax=Gymnopus androsaceus JB14 TaxID=1447944 RepID=A0A6A4GNW4_9AGAR|nr:hypothetical protein BT96DRAFT_1005523 [Gymnopus androsaceus JB14]
MSSQIPPRLLRFRILPPGLVPVSSIILVDSPAMTGRNDTINSSERAQVQDNHQSPSPAHNMLRSSLFFVIGLVAGGLFVGRLLPLPIDLDLVKAIIVGGIDHVSSLRLQDWLGFYIVCLLTFIAFVMRPRYVLVV